MKTDRPAEAIRKRKYYMGRRMLSGEARPEAILRGKVLVILYDSGPTSAMTLGRMTGADPGALQHSLDLLLARGTIEPIEGKSGQVLYRITCPVD